MLLKEPETSTDSNYSKWVSSSLSWTACTDRTCVSFPSGLSDMAGSEGVWDAERRTLHHAWEWRCTLGGVRRWAQSCLPQTFYHGSQPGWHGGGPLVAQGIYCITFIDDRDCHRDFLQEALGPAGFPSRTVCCGNKEKPVKWWNASPVASKGGKTQQML